MNKTFWQGLLNALFIPSNPPTPKTTHQTLAHFDDALEQSLAHDWQAVGGDIHLASHVGRRLPCRSALSGSETRQIHAKPDISPKKIPKFTHQCRVS